MTDECVVSDTNSPPPRPSAWQLRFGKKSTSRLHEWETVEEVEAEIPSSSVSEQLLRALDAKPKEQELLSRECADILIGRRNAFASEPELRLQVQENDPDYLAGDLFDSKYDHMNMTAEAKEIIRLRLQVETQTDRLRQAPRRSRQPKRQTEVRQVKQVQNNTATVMPSNAGKTDRLSRTSSQRNMMRSELHVRVQQANNQKSEEMSTREPPHQLNSRLTNSKVLHKTARSRKLPPQQLPMERRHEILNQAREARKIKAAENKELLKMLEVTPSDNNNDEPQEQRRLEEEIERLTLENQQAVALEERLQSRKARLEVLNDCFGNWQRYVKHRHLQEAQVVAAFNWRALKSSMSSWWRYTLRQSQMRAAEQARLVLVQEQEMRERAKQFCRTKYLPNWFYRWVVFVAERKEHRMVEGDVGRRRVQAEMLMERLLLKKTYKEEHQHGFDELSESRDNFGVVKLKQRPPVPVTMRESKIRGHFSTMSSSVTMVCPPQQTMNAWSDVAKGDTSIIELQQSSESVATPEPLLQSSPPKTSRAVKRVDSRYRAMEQRATERKLRREELKRKYEQTELRKREQQEEQHAAQEALLLQQKVEEKARIRERKQAEARALKEKQDRRDYLIAQRCEVKRHNRRRLLFYYAMLPWRKHHELNQRVEHNACRWHGLRTVYSHWERWHEFVKMCRKLRRRRERVQLQAAAEHYESALQRRALQGWMCQHQLTKARALAVWRQSQWNVLYRSWKQWQKRLARERADQRKRAVEAAYMLEQMRLRRILVRWKRVVQEAKAKQELDREKQLMWRKVRGWLNEDA